MNAQNGPSPSSNIELAANNNGSARRSRFASPIRPAALKLPLALACVAGAASFMIASTMPKQYRTDTTLYFIAQSGSAANSLLSVLGDSDVSDKATSIPSLGGLVTLPQVATNPNTAITILSSARCRLAVAQQCNLEAKWHIPMRLVLAKLDGASTFSVDKHGLLDIEISDTNPQLACDIANAYVSSLYSIATELSTSPSRQTRVFIDQQLADARGNMKSLERRLVNVEKGDTIPLPPDDLYKKMGDTMGQLETERVQAQSQLAGIEAEIDRIDGLSNVVASNSLNLPAQSYVAQQANFRLRSLEDQFQVAQQTLGPDNPEYVSLKVQLDAARAAVRKEVSREVSATKMGISPQVTQLITQRDGLRAEVASLNNAMAETRSNLAKMPKQAIRENELNGEIQIARAKIQMLEGEAARARIAERRDMPTFETIDPPVVPTDAFAPRRAFIAGFAAVAGFLIGLAITLWQYIDWSSPRTSDRREEEEYLPVEAG